MFKDRLEKVQTAIHKATEEAWKQQQQQQQQQGAGAGAGAGAADKMATISSSSSNSNSSPRGVDDNDNDNGNASFLLGMDLFGPDPTTLERGIRDKLEDLERQLKKVLALTLTENDDENDDGDGDGIATARTTTGTGITASSPTHSASQLQEQLHFLTQASHARTALDEALMSASPALRTEPPDLVEACQHLLQAVERVDQAESSMPNPYSSSANSRSSNNSNSNNAAIVEGLRQAIRRQRIELIHKACSVLDQCVTFGQASSTATAMDEGGVDSVVGRHGSDALSSCSVKSSTQLEEAYQVLETFATTTTNKTDSIDSTNTAVKNNDGTSTALNDTLQRLTQRLYQQVLLPILQSVPSSTDNVTANTVANTVANAKYIHWKVTESEDQPTARMIGVSISTNTSSKKGTLHRLEWHRTEVDSSQSVDPTEELVITAWKDTLSLIQRILLFVQQRILLGRPRLCQQVGTQLFGSPTALPNSLQFTALGLKSTLLGHYDHGLLQEQLLAKLADTCVPDQLDAKDIPSLLEQRSKALLQICEPFCKRLLFDSQLFMMDLPKDGTPPKLVSWCRDLPQHYVNHRRCVLLNQGRDILRTSDYHNTVRVGGDNANHNANHNANQNQDAPDKQSQEDAFAMALFQLQPSSISQVAHQLMALVRSTMDESIQMPLRPSTLRPTLYRTARELLQLFRAIIPTAHATEIHQVPRTAAIVHNDALYLAHHCLTLGLEYKEEYNQEDARGKLLQQTCVFVDMVPLFRELADASLGDMLELQAHQLVELVQPRLTNFTMALQSHDPVAEWTEAETAWTAGYYQLTHLAQFGWTPILSPRLRRQCLGHLASVLLNMFYRPLCHPSLQRISATARPFLIGLLKRILQDVSTLVVLPDDGLKYQVGGGDIDTQQQQQQRQALLEEACGMEWNKMVACVACLEIMTHSLSHIQAALTAGTFRHVSAKELTIWIRACSHVSSSFTAAPATNASESDDHQELQRVLQSLLPSSAAGTTISSAASAM